MKLTINPWFVFLALFLVACNNESDRWSNAVERIPEPALDQLTSQARNQLVQQQQSLLRLINSGSASSISVAGQIAEMGKLYLAYNFYLSAEAAFDQALQLSPNQHDWLYLRGVSLEYAGEIETASKAYTNFLQSKPDDIPALIRLAEIEILQNQTKQANQLLKRVLIQQPEHAAALAAAGRMALETGNPEQAVKRLTQALKSQPTANNLYYPLANALSQLDRTEEAKRYLTLNGQQKVVLADPLVEQIQSLVVGASSHIELARRAHQSGDTKTAMSHLEAALGYEPDNATALHNLATILGQHQRSLELLQHALSVSPKNLNIRFDLATALASLGRLQQAKTEFSEIVKARPDDKEAQRRLNAINAALEANQ